MTSAINGPIRAVARGQLPRMTKSALRLRPRSFARIIADSLNAVRNSSSLIARIWVASVRASFPAIIGRASNAGSFAGRANFTFHGQTSWEVCRQNCIAIPLMTGSQTLSEGGS